MIHWELCKWLNFEHIEQWYHVVLNKFWKQHPKQLLYSYLTLISQTIQNEQHMLGPAGKARLNSLVTFSRGLQCWQTSKNLYQLCTDTGCHLKDLSREMADRDRWRERVKRVSCYQHNLMITMMIMIICTDQGIS